MTDVKNKTSVDTFVASETGNVNRNFDSYKYLSVGVPAGKTRYSYLLIGLPFKQGAKTNVQSGKLRLWTTAAWAGAVTVTVRPITQSWVRNRVTWNKKPAAGAAFASVTVNNPIKGTMLEFDVQAMLQSVSNGSPYYGFRVESSSTSARYVEGSSSAWGSRRPELEVDFSDAPLAPSNLIPSQGRFFSVQYPTLQSDFADVSGSTTMQSMQFQFDAAGTDVGGVDYDSGIVAVDHPEVWTDPASPLRPAGMPAWGGFADNEVSFWRNMVQDSAGQWSEWSDWTQVGRKVKGVVTILNPDASAIMGDASFAVLWAYSGIQKAFNVIVRDVNGVIVVQSGKITSTDTDWQVPSTAKFVDNGSYTVEVQVWDTVDRIGIPNDPAYSTATAPFVIDFDVSVAPVTAFTVTQDADAPRVVLRWHRDLVPDKFDVYRDGVVIASPLWDAVDLGGDDYEYVDKYAPAGEDSTWKVVAVENNKGAANSPEITFKPYLLAPWVGDDVEGFYLFNPEVSASKAENQELVQFIGNEPSIVVSTGKRGFEGTITGRVIPESVPGKTMKEIKAIIDRVFAAPGEERELHFYDEAIPAYIYGADAPAGKDVEGIYYTATFSFGEL